jgi:hypothetical protein
MSKYAALFDDYTPTPPPSGPAVGEYESGPLSQQELARSARLAKDATAEGDVDMSDPRWQRLTGNTPADAAEREQRDEARGFLKFAGTGAAGELATPLISRGIGSVTDRARAIQAARTAARPAPVVSDPAALSPVEAGPAIRFPRRGDFYVPRDGDMGPGLFSGARDVIEPGADAGPEGTAPPMSVVAPEMEDPN